MLSLSFKGPNHGAIGPLSKEGPSAFEKFPRRFLHEVTDLPSLASFAGAQNLSQMVGWGILRCLGRTTPATRILAGLGALMLEAPAFVGLHRGLSRLVPSKQIPQGSLGEEIAQTYRTLLTYRLFGAMAHSFLKGEKVSVGLATFLSLGSMYGGIFSANIWNRKSQGEKILDYGDIAQESLVTLAQLQVTAQVLRHLPKAGAFERDPNAVKPPTLESAPGLIGHPALAGIPNHAISEINFIKSPMELNWFAKAKARAGVDSPKLPDSADNGPLGRFVIRRVNKVTVYMPVPESRAPGSTKGTIILLSGLSSNHTRWGETPKNLARDNWRVRVLIIPGFEVMNENDFLKSFSPKKLAEYWQREIQRAVEILVGEHQKGFGDLYIGGYSMGGAAAAAFGYGSLPENLQRQVSGLILASPSYHTTFFETPSKFRNWFTRRVFLPLVAFLGLDYPKISKYNSDLAPHVESSVIRPWKVDYAAVLFNENARARLARYKSYELPRTLLIHTGKGDPVVSPKAAEFVKEIFQERLEKEILIPEEDGHYPLVNRHRATAHSAILDFVHRKS